MNVIESPYRFLLSVYFPFLRFLFTFLSFVSRSFVCIRARIIRIVAVCFASKRNGERRADSGNGSKIIGRPSRRKSVEFGEGGGSEPSFILALYHTWDNTTRIRARRPSFHEPRRNVGNIRQPSPRLSSRGVIIGTVVRVDASNEPFTSDPRSQQRLIHSRTRRVGGRKKVKVVDGSCAIRVAIIYGRM